MLRSVIVGTGHHVPERVVSNEALTAYVGGDAAWIEERTGIVQRRWASASERTSQLGHEATKRALEAAHLTAPDLDALIFATLSPDMNFPGCGVFLQDLLGVYGMPALDVRNQCTGYLYALQVADAWIRAGVYRRVLIVGAEIHSAGLDLSEEGRAITVLFGDGAGAVILEGREVETGGGVVEVRLGADGSGAASLCLERPGSIGGAHLTQEHIRERKHFPYMNGRQVFRRAIETLTRELTELFERHDLHDPARRARVLLVPHQANRLINTHVARTLGLDEAQVVHTIQDYGNTTAASIPMALDIARTAGRAPEGTLLIHAAFGSGYTWGTALVEL